MSQSDIDTILDHGDAAPGDEPAGRHEVVEGLLGYAIGLFLAAFITGVAFFIAGTNLVWGPSIPSGARGVGDRSDRHPPRLFHPHHYRAG